MVFRKCHWFDGCRSQGREILLCKEEIVETQIFVVRGREEGKVFFIRV